MRRRDFVKLGALFVPSVAVAGTTIIQGATTKLIQGATTKLIQTAGGFTSRITFSGTDFSTMTIGRGGTVDNYKASRFLNIASGYTIGKIEIPLFKSGSPNFNINCSVYNEVSSAPGSVIGSTSANIATSGMPASEGAMVAFLPSAAISASTAYWVVLHQTGSANDSTNFINWGFINNGVGSTNLLKMSSDGSTWSAESNYIGGFDMPGQMIIYSTP